MSITEQRIFLSLGVAGTTVAVASLGACGWWGGGGGGEGVGASSSRREVVATDFAGLESSGGAVDRVGVGGEWDGGEPRARATVVEIDVESARNGRDDVVVLMGPPGNMGSAEESGVEGKGSEESGAEAGGGGGRVGESRLLVDQLVGQINGRPVFANEFFGPMNERLRNEAARLSERDWLVMAKKDIEGALWDKLRDDLLLGEFESSLTPEQKVGVVAFVESIRSDLVSGNLGSEAQANVRLLESEGVDLATKVSDISKRRFILEQLRRAIGDRVQVSYWDVRQYYDQHIDEFVPVPVARFVIIRAPQSDSEKVARIEAALGSGEYFESVAARESTWKPGAGNGHEMAIKSREYASERYFGPEPLNAAAIGLSVGGVTERVEFGGDDWWLLLVSIDQGPGRSLYEVQTEIESRLRSTRQREEEIRYFERLFRRGSFSDIKQMSGRLLTFAGERYLIQDRMKARAALAEIAAATKAQGAPTATATSEK